jgi:hypothetical protein
MQAEADLVGATGRLDAVRERCAQIDADTARAAVEEKAAQAQIQRLQDDLKKAQAFTAANAVNALRGTG